MPRVVKRKPKVKPKTAKKKVTKKKKKSAKKKSTKQKSKYAVKDRHARVLKVVGEMNKALGGDGKVMTGAEVEDLQFRKERTGNPVYDYVTDGGLIRGGASCAWGPDRTAKTSQLAHTIREYQRRGLSCMLGAVETFDKPWWRRIGVYIPYSAFEIDSLPWKEDKKAAKRYNAYYEKLGRIPLTLAMHANGIRVLDMVVGASKRNVFDLIGVDSLGAVVDIDEVEGKSLSDQKYGGNSRVMGVFSNFITSTFNFRFNEDGSYNAAGDFDNQTTVLCLNQARVEIGTKANAKHKQFHPPGGYGLRHLWNQALFHSEGEEFAEYITSNGRRVRDVKAREFRIFGAKMRGGPEQRQAGITMSLKDWQDGPVHHKSGELDVWGSLRALSVQLGVIERRGANLYYGDSMWKGREAMEHAMREDDDLYEALYDDMLAAAHRDSVGGSVPEVPDL